jgi:NitT/TauT family transport system permease protein
VFLRLATPISVGFSIIALWFFASLSIDSLTFPGPLETGGALFQILIETSFYLSLFDTIWISTLGLSLGAVFSYLAGLLLTQSRFLEQSLVPSINILRVIPAIVLMPLLLSTLGTTAFAIIVLTSYVIFAKLIVYVLDGLKATRQEFVDLVKICKLGEIHSFLRINLPISLRYVISGIQLSSSRAYGTVVLGGLFIGSPGLGKDLDRARVMAEFDQMFAYGFFLAFLGILLYYFFISFEKKILFQWGWN